MISKKRFIVILGCSCLALSIFGGCDSNKATHNSGAIEEETEFAALDVEYTVSKSLSSSEINEGEPEFVILGWLIK